MACRAACRWPRAVAGLIAVGGDVPPELDREALSRISAAFVARGAQDEWYSSATWQGDQTRLSIKVTGLKPASQLKLSGRRAYVVWLQQSNKHWRNIGVLQLNGKQATLATTVPTGNMFVLVTAENNAHGDNPSGPEVMQATLLGQ